MYALQKRGQFMLDLIESEKSVGFHAPEEAARILGQATNLLRQAQVLVRDPSFKPEIPDMLPAAAGDAHAGPGTPGKTVGNPTGGTGGAATPGGQGGTGH